MDSSPDLSPFLLDLDLYLKALDLDLEVLPASPFFKSFVLYLYLKRGHADPGPSSSSTQNDSEEPPPKRQKLFGNYTHTREHHSDTATDVSVAELLAR